jgi:hypothetical protein
MKTIRQRTQGKQRWTGTVERRLIMGKRPRRKTNVSVMSGCPVKKMNGLHIESGDGQVHLDLRDARTAYRVLQKHFEGYLGPRARG